jgi:hypothetical protein
MLLDKLDQPRGIILLEMEIGEAPVGAVRPTENPKPEGKSPGAAALPFRLVERPANMETTGRVRLTAMDNQTDFVQMGARVPMVTGVSGSPTTDQPTSRKTRSRSSSCTATRTIQPRSPRARRLLKR